MTTREDIIEEIREAVEEAAREAVNDSISVDFCTEQAEGLFERWIESKYGDQLSNSLQFTADELLAIVSASYLASNYLQVLDGSTSALSLEAKRADGDGVPVFSAQGMKYVCENLIRRITEVGNKAHEIRGSLK